MNKDDCQIGKEVCNNFYICSKPCIYLQTVRQLSGYKNKPLNEMLGPPEITDDHINKTDYKEEIIDKQISKQLGKLNTIKEVREIQGMNRRAIAAMLYADMPLKEVAFILNKSERTIRRICHT